jgi:hypothetical protein
MDKVLSPPRSFLDPMKLNLLKNILAATFRYQNPVHTRPTTLYND